MPRQVEQYSDTPFARVLTAFMWSQTPPWTSARLAETLGIHRNRASNWLYHGMLPDTAGMLQVMAKLGIPVQALIEAYAEDGLPVPPLTYDDPAATLHASQHGPRGATAGAATGAPKLAPAEVARQAAMRRAEEERHEWETMFAHTRKVMTAAGMPIAAVDAMIAELEKRRTGKPTAAQRRLAEEMERPADDPQHPQNSQDTQDPRDDTSASTRRSIGRNT